jgi:hypothetical protein
MGMCEQQKLCLCPEELPACSKFEQKVVTNGDKIRAMSNDEIMFALFRICKCDECPADTGKCRHMKNAQCLDSLAEYLNAPAEIKAESEGEDE